MKEKERAILGGPIISELGWEILRFAPYIIYKYLNQYKNCKLIILTRPERFDLYGEYADILVPLKIEGDYIKYKPNCFRLDNFPINKYKEIANRFFNKYKDRYKIIDHVYPDISGKKFLHKDYYPKNQLLSNFRPRTENKKLVLNYIKQDKPWVVLSPRYRKGFKRNWPYWNKLYDIIWKSNLKSKFYFIIAGKKNEYVPDKKGRFFDLNDISLNNNSSLIGITIFTVRNSILTIGSQSAIPNLSLLLKTKVLEWGDQKLLHTKTYNYTNTEITYIDDKNFNINYEIIFNRINSLLKG